MKIKTIKPKLNFIRKQVRPLLCNVKITSDSLECTDLETYVRIKDNFEMQAGLQNFETLGLIDSVEDKDEQYPAFDFEIDPVESVQIDTTDIVDLLQYASKDETRLHLNCVTVDACSLVACNGHTLKHIDLDQKIDGTYLIPRTALNTVIKICKAYKRTGLTDFHFNEEYAVIDNDDFTIKIRLIQREYVKWSAVVPNKYNYSFNVTDWIDYKELKTLFNKRGACKIESIEGNAVLTSTEHPNNQYIIGKTKDTFELGFNIAYLEIASNGLKEFEIKFNNEVSPILVNNAIIMPLKV